MVSISANSVMAMRNAILQQNSALQNANAAASKTGSIGAVTPNATTAPLSSGGSVTEFADAMKAAVKQVNALQTNAGDAADAFERGDTTDIAAVMLAKQQASIGFEATLQVRNKLLSAYKDIMSMPV